MRGRNNIIVPFPDAFAASGNFLCPKPSYSLTDAAPRGNLTVPIRLIQLIRYERWCCTTISINYRDSRPIYEQVRDGLRRLIVSGTLPLGEKLPSVRELSTQLTINPNTIQRAYRELETEGYICSVAGRGSYVCAQIPDDPARQDTLLQQFDAAVQELLYLGMRSEELRRRIPEGGTNHD